MSRDDTPRIKVPKSISDRFIDRSGTMLKYCPKCYSKLYPVDDKPMQQLGVCSYCTQRTERKGK